MKFIAEEARSDGTYIVDVEADSWAAAEDICRASGWKLKGKSGFTIPATEKFGIEEANALVRDLNDAAQSSKH